MLYCVKCCDVDCLHHDTFLLVTSIVMFSLIQCKNTSLRWRAVLKVKKIPTLPPCVEDVLFVIKSGGHLLWDWWLSLRVATSPKLWAVFCPPFICAPANSLVRSSAGFPSVGEISEAFKVTGSNLTRQYSCPIPVRGSAGDK